MLRGKKSHSLGVLIKQQSTSTPHQGGLRGDGDGDGDAATTSDTNGSAAAERKSSVTLTRDVDPDTDSEYKFSVYARDLFSSAPQTPTSHFKRFFFHERHVPKRTTRFPLQTESRAKTGTGEARGTHSVSSMKTSTRAAHVRPERSRSLQQSRGKERY